MNVDLTELNNGLVDKVDININYSFNKEQLTGTDVRKLDDLKITGYINKDVMNNLYIELSANGEMILPCAVTLNDVKYPFSFEISGELEQIIEEIEDFSKKSENSIDIFPIIWENILMEIPMKVVSEEAKNYKAEGNGWKLITESDAHEEINPELAKLKELL